MIKLIQVALLASTFNFSTVQPISKTKFLIGTTVIAATSAFLYHVWTNYHITRTLTGTVNRRCNSIEKHLDDIKTDLAALDEKIANICQTMGEDRQLILLLLYEILPPDRKEHFKLTLKRIKPELCTQLFPKLLPN